MIGAANARPLPPQQGQAQAGREGPREGTTSLLSPFSESVSPILPIVPCLSPSSRGRGRAARLPRPLLTLPSLVEGNQAEREEGPRLPGA